MQARRAAAVLLQLLDDALRPGKIEIGNRDVVTKAMKLRDASPAQTAGPASDDDMLFFHADSLRNVSYMCPSLKRTRSGCHARAFFLAAPVQQQLRGALYLVIGRASGRGREVI